MWGRTAIAEILTLGPDASLPRRWGSTCAWWGGWTTAPPVTPRLSPPRAAAPTTWASWITAPATTSARPGTPSATARRVSGAGTGLPRGDAGRDASERGGGVGSRRGLRGTARRIAAFPCRRDVRVPRRLRGGRYVVPRPPARRAGRGRAFLHLLLRKRRAGSGAVAGPARAARGADGILSSCCSLLPTARQKGWSFSPICPTTPLPKRFLSP